MPKTTTQARRFVFTLNNPQQPIDTKHDCIRYCIYQKEKGQNGTIHYQGYVEFNKRMSTRQISKLKGGWNRMHLEGARGTQKQCIEYCTKNDTRIESPKEYGTKAKEKETRKSSQELEDAVSKIKSGVPMKDVAESESIAFVKNHKGLNALKCLTSEVRNWKTKGWVFFGDTNTGKSHKADEMFPNAYHMCDHGPNKLWFDDYDGEADIIINDFTCKMDIQFLLNFIDKWPQKLPIKGGHVQNLAKNIVFTSNINYDDWYRKYFEKMSMHKPAIDRRFEEIWEFRGTSHHDVSITKHRTEYVSIDAGKEVDMDEKESGNQDNRPAPPSLGAHSQINDDILIEDETWNVGGGAECDLCGDDLRRCRNKCKIEDDQMESPTSIEILKRMNRNEWIPIVTKKLDKYFEKLKCTETWLQDEEDREKLETINKDFDRMKLHWTDFTTAPQSVRDYLLEMYKELDKDKFIL